MFEDTVLQLNFKGFTLIVYETTPCSITDPRSLAWEIRDTYAPGKIVKSSEGEFKMGDQRRAMQEALDHLKEYV